MHAFAHMSMHTTVPWQQRVFLSTMQHGQLLPLLQVTCHTEPWLARHCTMYLEVRLPADSA